jgi:hypothetical protein
VQSEIAQGWGKDYKFSALMECSDSNEWRTGSPLLLFYNDMYRHDEFKKMLKDAPNVTSFSTLSKPKLTGFIKGMLLACKGKTFFDRPKWGVILAMSMTAKDALDALVSQLSGNPAAPTEDDPYGWNTKYAVGDPVGAKTGLVVEMWDEKRMNGTDDKEVEINTDGAAAGSEKGGSDFSRYGVRVYPKKPRLSLDFGLIAKNDELFEKSLRFMTGEEQLNELLIPGFGHTYKDALLYTFGGKGVLPPSFEFGMKVVDMAKPETAVAVTARQLPTTPVSQTAPFDTGDPDFQVNVGDPGEGSNAEEEPAEPVRVQNQATTPAPTPASSGTADRIRERIAAAKAAAVKAGA